MKAAADREERFVDVVAAFVADSEAALRCSQAIVRSPTQRCLPSPEPCSVLGGPRLDAVDGGARVALREW